MFLEWATALFVLITVQLSIFFNIYASFLQELELIDPDLTSLYEQKRTEIEKKHLNNQEKAQTVKSDGG